MGTRAARSAAARRRAARAAARRLRRRCAAAGSARPQLLAGCSATSVVVSTWQLVSSSCSLTPRAAAWSATASCGDRLAGVRVDEKELLLDANRGMAGHGAKTDPARRRSHDGPDRRWLLACGLRRVRSLADQIARTGRAKHGIRQVSPDAYHRAMAKDFRFGVGPALAKSRARVQDAARRAEDLGFDVLHVPDHSGRRRRFRL